MRADSYTPATATEDAGGFDISTGDGLPAEDTNDPKDEVSITGQVHVAVQGDAKVWGSREDLGNDAWSAVILSLSRYVPVMVLKRSAGQSIALDLATTAVCVAVIVTNLGLQLATLYYISTYVVEPGIRQTQIRYGELLFHTTDEHGNIDQEAWDKYEGKDQICGLAIGYPIFYYLVMFVWVLSNMLEWRDIARLGTAAWTVRTCSTAREMLLFMETDSFEKGGPCLIVGLTRWSRALMFGLVLLPRLLISLYLTLLGFRMLTSSEEFSDMVLNSLGLTFVTSIDELLCDALLPASTKLHLEETDIFLDEGPRPKGVTERDQEQWASMKRIIIFLSLAVILMFAYCECIQNILPMDVREMNGMCQDYILRQMTPLCGRMAWLDGSSTCYADGIGDNVMTLE